MQLLRALVLLGLASAASVVPGPGSCVSDVVIDLSQCISGLPAQDNLGGLGPDTGPRELRYKDVGQFNGSLFDLVVTNMSEYRRALTKYPDGCTKDGCNGVKWPDGCSDNGCSGVNWPRCSPHGCIKETSSGCSGSGTVGNINVARGYAPRILFELRDGATEQVIRPPGFYFTFLDLDGQYGSKDAESLVSEDHSDYVLESPTNVILGGSPPKNTIFGSCYSNPASGNIPASAECTVPTNGQASRTWDQCSILPWRETRVPIGNSESNVCAATRPDAESP